MKKINLENYGIRNVKEIFYNLSFDELYKHETDSSLEGFEKVYVTDLGAIAVDTGVFTGRSPQDKFIVKESSSEVNIWWRNEQRTSSDNKPVSEEVWSDLKRLAARFINNFTKFMDSDAAIQLAKEGGPVI